MMSMMVVDDSSIIRRKIDRFNRESQKFNVVAIAENGLDAIKKYDEFQPEVITMDLTMPHMDGIECIEALMAKNPDLRILVVSALTDKATGIEALQKGAQGFLCKPFTEEEFSHALTELVED